MAFMLSWKGIKKEFFSMVVEDIEIEDMSREDNGVGLGVVVDKSDVVDMLLVDKLLVDKLGDN